MGLDIKGSAFEITLIVKTLDKIRPFKKRESFPSE